MNMLAALFAGAALLAGAVLAGYRMRTRGPAAAGKSVFLAGFAGVLLVSSLGVYATLGRWSDWDKAVSRSCQTGARAGRSHRGNLQG